MRSLFCIIAILLAVASWAALPTTWSTLAPETLVIVGKNAPAQEQTAATNIATALRAIGGQTTNLIVDQDAWNDLTPWPPTT